MFKMDECKNKLCKVCFSKLQHLLKHKLQFPLKVASAALNCSLYEFSSFICCALLIKKLLIFSKVKCQ